MADLWDKFFGAKVLPDPAVNLKWIENEQLKLLLKEAHDIIDDKNAQMEASDGTLVCCGNTGEYDEQGLIHNDDCILVRIRNVFHV